MRKRALAAALLLVFSRSVLSLCDCENTGEPPSEFQRNTSTGTQEAWAYDHLGRRFNFLLDPLDETIGKPIRGKHSMWEDWMQPCFDLFADENATAIDIGGNIGVHSVYMAARFHSVIVFEPQPGVWAQNLGNLRANEMSRSRVCRCALSSPNNRGGVARMRTRNVGNWGATMINRVRPHNVDHEEWESSPVHRARDGHQLEHVVPLSTLDDEWKRVGSPRIAVIKLDAENHEPHIIEGATELLSTHQPPILFEEWTWLRRKCLTIKALEKHGYLSHLLYQDHDFIALHKSDPRAAEFGHDLITIDGTCTETDGRGEAASDNLRAHTKSYQDHNCMCRAPANSALRSTSPSGECPHDRATLRKRRRRRQRE